MSDNMSIPKHNQNKEAVNRRQAMELRRLAETNQKELLRVQKHTETQAARIEKDFEVQVNADKNDYEKKLNQMRAKYAKRLTEENAKFESSLQDLKLAQDGRMTEIRSNNEREVMKTLDDHKEYMERAKQRFEEQKSKYEA